MVPIILCLKQSIDYNFTCHCQATFLYLFDDIGGRWDNWLKISAYFAVGFPQKCFSALITMYLSAGGMLVRNVVVNIIFILYLNHRTLCQLCQCQGWHVKMNAAVGYVYVIPVQRSFIWIYIYNRNYVNVFNTDYRRKIITSRAKMPWLAQQMFFFHLFEVQVL